MRCYLLTFQKIDDVFIGHACDILGDTETGLTGSEIVKYCNRFAIDFNVNIPITDSNFGRFGSKVPNKRTALYRNLIEFNASQQLEIINYLCELPKFNNNKNVGDLKIKLCERYKKFPPENMQANVKNSISDLADKESSDLHKIMSLLLSIYYEEDEIYISDNDLRFKNIEKYESCLKKLNAKGYFSQFKSDVIGGFRIELSEKAFEHFKSNMKNYDNKSLPSVFISYNRKSSVFVDDIEKAVKNYCNLKRDRNNLSAWDSITDFMKTIRKEDFAVIVVSDAYLKSIACLYEVIQLMKDDDWDQKTMYVVMDDATRIYDVMNRLEYIAYWNNYCDKLSEAINKLPSSSVYKQAEELKKAEMIRNSIGEFLVKVAEKNNPSVHDATEKIVERLNQANTY